MSNVFTAVVMLSVVLNLFIFIAGSQIDGVSIDDSNQPLTNYVNVNNPDAISPGDGVPTDINTEGGVLASSGLGFIDWLSKIWSFVTGIFRYLFSVAYLMVDLQFPSWAVLLFGIPFGVLQILGIFSFIRGVTA